jgi:hypothetical protein
MNQKTYCGSAAGWVDRCLQRAERPSVDRTLRVLTIALLGAALWKYLHNFPRFWDVLLWDETSAGELYALEFQARADRSRAIHFGVSMGARALAWARLLRPGDGIDELGDHYA